MDKINVYLRTKYDVDDTYFIRVNGDVVCKNNFSQTDTSFEINLLNGKNILEIEVIDKSPTNIDLSYLMIDEIIINKLAMRTMLNDHGYIIPNYSIEKGLAEWFQKEKGYVPEKWEKNRFLSMVGIYVFEFESPVEKFVIDYYNSFPDNYKKYYNESLSGYERLLQKIKNER